MNKTVIGLIILVVLLIIGSNIGVYLMIKPFLYTSPNTKVWFLFGIDELITQVGIGLVAFLYKKRYS